MWPIGGHAVWRRRTRLPTEPHFRTNRLGVATSLRRNCLIMERNAQEELKAHLMESNEEYRRLASQHSDLAKSLDALEELPHLTHEEQLEETRLKKMKLRLKDQMEAILRLFVVAVAVFGEL